MNAYEISYQLEGLEETTILYAKSIFKALDEARKTWGKDFTGRVKFLGHMEGTE